MHAFPNSVGQDLLPKRNSAERRNHAVALGACRAEAPVPGASSHALAGTSNANTDAERDEAQLQFARRELASHVAAARSIMSGAVVRTPVADGCVGDSGEEGSTADTGDDQQAYPRREHELLMMMTQETVYGTIEDPPQALVDSAHRQLQAAGGHFSIPPSGLGQAVWILQPAFARSASMAMPKAFAAVMTCAMERVKAAAASDALILRTKCLGARTWCVLKAISVVRAVATEFAHEPNKMVRWRQLRAFQHDLPTLQSYADAGANRGPSTMPLLVPSNYRTEATATAGIGVAQALVQTSSINRVGEEEALEGFMAVVRQFSQCVSDDRKRTHSEAF